jgi:hypothetical protein
VKDGFYSKNIAWLVAFEITGALCVVLTSYLCWKYNKYFQADADCLHQFRRELDYKKDKIEKLFSE